MKNIVRDFDRSQPIVEKNSVRNKKNKHKIIPFFIPHIGCPHICVFCNQPHITGQSMPVKASMIAQVIEEYVTSTEADTHWEVAFFGGSFSAIPRSVQKELLTPAYDAWKAGLIDAIRCSTRPDAVDDEELDFLYTHGLRTVELGVQSMDDDILVRSKRGHTSEQVKEAVQRLRQRGFQVGLQLLPGLPGETWTTLIRTAVAISTLQPDFVRIYPVLVIAHTELADMYRAGSYTPLSIKEAVAYSAFLKSWFEMHHIRVIRTGLQSTEDLDAGTHLVAGPYEPAMGELVINQQWQERLLQCIDQYMEVYNARPRTITIGYPSRLTSQVRGVGRKNMIELQAKYPAVQWVWRETDMCHLDRMITCTIDGDTYILHRFML